MQNCHLEQLKSLQKLVEETTQQQYTASIDSLPHSTMGGHVRHILEFFDCFLEGFSKGEIDYTKRKRDVSVEEFPNKASLKCQQIIESLQALTDTQMSQSVAIWSEMQEKSEKLPSSISRELEYLFHHMVHHLALIGVYLRSQGVSLHPEFGVAPSTVQYWDANKSACAP